MKEHHGHLSTVIFSLLRIQLHIPNERYYYYLKKKKLKKILYEKGEQGIFVFLKFRDFSNFLLIPEIETEYM